MAAFVGKYPEPTIALRKTDIAPDGSSHAGSCIELRTSVTGILGGCHAHHPLEVPCEVTLVGETNIDRYMRRRSAFLQKRPATLNSNMRLIDMRWNPYKGSEDMGKVELAQPRY